MPSVNPSDPCLMVVGAGPVGLVLALLAARHLPAWQVQVHDARTYDFDFSSDARTLALSLGSVQLLQRLGVWPHAATQAITEVHVSQAPPSPAQGQLSLRASELAVPMLGAVVGHGVLVQALQAAWLAQVAAWPQRLG